MKFKLYAARSTQGQVIKTTLTYDNMTSELRDAQGSLYAEGMKHSCWKDFEAHHPEDPSGKNGEIRTLKIQLGLSCNYSCDYCNQRFVPHAENGHPDDVDKFMRNLDSWLESSPKKIEFWGGEPFVYWKTLKPLAEALRKRFPSAKFLTITNGSLLTPEINEWLDEMGFAIGISHDGPGQPTRGPDPLADAEQKKNILDLWRRLRPKGMISFNSMIYRTNMDRGEVQRYFKELMGDDNTPIGEGGFIDPYDEGGDRNSLQSSAERLGYRRLTMEGIKKRTFTNFGLFRSRLNEWITSIKSRRPASTLGQKCGMDRLDTIAVDLKGNVLTCQNVSAKAMAPNGRPHLIGHVSNLERVKLRTATHWRFRPDCKDCPVLQACKGSCMFLEGERWQLACDNAYSDHVPFFAAAIEMITGYLPYYIEPIGGELPEERKNIWGGPRDESRVPKREPINRRKELERA